MKTLQFYVARELVKTFALTAIGLTLTFSLCGGALNMVKVEVLTAVELARFLGFILPVATTLTLPVAALFACAMVYGRLAADNEFDACKASGINIHRLLAPAIGLSLVTAAFTFTFSNYMIPNFIEQIEVMVRKDIQKIAIQALSRQGYIRYGPYVLYAGRSNLFDRDRESDVMHIQKAAFLELGNDSLVRCGTAGEIRIDFWADTHAGEPTVEAVMFDVHALDLQRRQYFQERERPFGSVKIPKKLEHEPKWLNLPQLFDYYEHPTLLPEIRDSIRGIRAQLRDNLFYRDVYQQLTGPRKALRLEDHRRGRGYEIRARHASLDPDDFRPGLDGVTVRQWWKDQEGNSRKREYEADTCSIRVKRGYPSPRDVVVLTLRGKVVFTDSLDPLKRVQHKKIELEEVALPEKGLEAEQGISDDELIGLDLVQERGIRDRDELEEKLPHFGLGDRVRDARIATLADLINLKHEIVGIIHSRLAFSASALVTLLMAAALGIIFRGGQLLTAFVISFMPGLLVVVMNIMGRQLVEKTGTHVLGIVVIWAGIGLLALADGVVLTRYLRR